MSYERVQFLSDKALFKGKVYEPSSLSDCKGVVIFTHGLGYCDRQYKISGDYFAKNNYLMLTYNLRGHGGPGGKWTLQNSVEDLIEGINFIERKYDFQNKNRICVIGHSTGALITLLASLRDKRIKFGSVVTTVTSLTDSYLHWFESGYNEQVRSFFKTKGVLPEILQYFLGTPEALEEYRKGSIAKDRLNIPHRYGMLHSDSFDDFFHEIAYSVNILDESKPIEIPLLLFRGEYDEVMDVRKTNELYEKVNSTIPCKLYITGSKNHFHNDCWPLIQGETLKFFDEFCAFKPLSNLNLGKDVLVIDDEELVRKTLKSLLKRNGYQSVDFAADGASALEKIKSLMERKLKSYDLIVADIRMPGLDGVETVRRARKIMATNAPVLFITGFGNDHTEESIKGLGYVDYLEKPFDTNTFLSRVDKHLKSTSDRFYATQ